MDTAVLVSAAAVALVATCGAFTYYDAVRTRAEPGSERRTRAATVQTVLSAPTLATHPFLVLVCAVLLDPSMRSGWMAVAEVLLVLSTVAGLVVVAPADLGKARAALPESRFSSVGVRPSSDRG